MYKRLIIIVLISFFSFKSTSQNFRNEMKLLEVNKLLHKEYLVRNDSAIKALEKRMPIKLNNIQALLLAASFRDVYKLTDEEYNIIKDIAKQIGEELKKEKKSIIFISESKLCYMEIMRHVTKELIDVLISSEDFKRYRNSYFDEISKIIQNTSASD